MKIPIWVGDAVFDVLGADAFEADLIAVREGDAFRPMPELVAAPFKAMVGMPHFAALKSGEQHIVIADWGGDDDRGWACMRKQRLLEGGQPFCIHMLDDFDYRRRVEALEPIVAIDQRTLQQFDPFALHVRHLVQPQPIAGRCEDARSDLDADDARKAR